MGNILGITSVDGAIKIFTKVLEALQKLIEKQHLAQSKLVEQSKKIEARMDESEKEIKKAQKVIDNLNNLLN